MSLNNTVRILSRPKSLFVSRERKPRKVRFGLFKNLVLDLDLTHETQVLLGLYERETFKYIRQATQNCDWAVDIGAGKGELSVYLLKRSHAKRIVAFEPQDEELRFFKQNLRLNGLDIAAQRLSISKDFAGQETNGAGYTSLDSLGLDYRQRGFLKIDVDGAEMDVLKSGHRLLSNGNVEVLVETHTADLERDCIDWLKEHGYFCHIIKNAWWRILLPEQRPIPHNRWLWACRREELE